MRYLSTLDLILDLEKKGELIRITEEVDPNLEMAEIQRRVYAMQGPALLFEKVKGSPFPAASNLFGTQERVRYIFRKTIEPMKQIVELKGKPFLAIKHPLKYAKLIPFLFKGLPRKVSPHKAPALWRTTTLEALPGIISWKKDGGRYITLPQVYSEHPDGTGPMQSNLGMYRVQLDGNKFKKNEIGIHYQIHRGISKHHQECLKRNIPLKVSVFIGGPPAMSIAAVMPLPENLPEVAFAGLLANSPFRYCNVDGYTIAAEADFCITGEIPLGAVKPEGPFGDHLGYYSLIHNMPVMKVHKVYHRKDAIWPFTVVGRPPQEDTEFGAFIHDITESAMGSEVSGLREVHAIDEAGVHPLLLAIGSDSYVPYMERSRPAELLTVANGILGTGQLSLAKYLIIAAEEDNASLTTKNVPEFFAHVLKRINLERDVHFVTRTTIDTLDYSGDGLNQGSKVILAAMGKPIRKLSNSLSRSFKLPRGFSGPAIPAPGILVVTGPKYQKNSDDIKKFADSLKRISALKGFPLIIVADDSEFCAKDFSNFLWVTFTRSNPAADIHGVHSFIEDKHWGCKGSLIIDARIKPHHAPPLVEDPKVSRRVDELLKKFFTRPLVT